MIYPTELTVCTGTVTYGGDPESDERIASREVRVSVTFQVEDPEADLADLAFAKAAEVERARLAALERIERDLRDPYPADPPEGEACDGSESDGSEFDPSVCNLEPPDEERNDEEGNDNEGDCAPDPFPQEADCLSAPCGLAVNAGRPANGGHARGGVPAPLPALPPCPPGAAHAAGAETDCATRPQVLALGSHAGGWASAPRSRPPCCGRASASSGPSA